VVVARAAIPGGEIVLQVRVTSGRLDYRLDRRFREYRAAKVGVEHDPRGVHHAAEAPAGEEFPGRGGDGLLRGLGLLSGPDLPPRAVQDLPDGCRRRRPPVPPDERLAGVDAQHRVHCRQPPEPLPLSLLPHTPPSITRRCPRPERKALISGATAGLGDGTLC
jgi:hypothetical protein